MPRWVSLLLFFVPVLAVLLVGHVYLYRRLVRDVTKRKWLRRTAQGLFAVGFVGALSARRSGEGRVGKECRSRGSPDH